MPAAKMETAAQKYLRLKAEQEVLHDVKCSCGTDWKCKREGKDFWITSGILPAKLAATFVKVASASEADILNSVDADQLINGIEFSSKVVRHTAVEPRIVEFPDPEKNEIGYDQVMQCCYATLRDWQMTGGDEAARLGNFPQG